MMGYPDIRPKSRTNQRRKRQRAKVCWRGKAGCFLGELHLTRDTKRAWTTYCRPRSGAVPPWHGGQRPLWFRLADGDLPHHGPTRCFVTSCSVNSWRIDSI